ncbi:TIGR01777 family oxidoreductase [Ascidiimonas aurantiaca]|uniref:TIGR01777 family oxidoreductase n=1 Tax=Ascidiimonas aurantiaca TaxID=1685432 RepID=UPI0030ED6101
MKILITGATGLVGNEIVRLCHKKGFPVHFLTTNPSKRDHLEGAKGFYWNPSKNEIDMDCFEGVTAIINLAGANIAQRWTASYKKTILRSRVDSLSLLKQAIDRLEDHNITSFVSASAIGIYPSSLSEYYEEDLDKPDTSFLGTVTQKWEKAALEIEQTSIPVSIIRIGLVLSSQGGALPKIVKPVRLYAGAAFGSGEQWQSWIHITDLADMFLFLISNEMEGIYNGVAPNPITNKKLVNETACVLRKKIVLPNIPSFVLKMLLGEMSTIVLSSQRVSSKKIEREGFVFRHPNSKGALEEILLEKTNTSSQEQAVT